MQPPPGRLAPYLLVEVFHNACVILATMWSFFGSTRFIHLAPAAAAVSYFAHPISWPKRNVKTHALPSLCPSGVKVQKLLPLVLTADFKRKRREHI